MLTNGSALITVFGPGQLCKKKERTLLLQRIFVGMRIFMRSGIVSRDTRNIRTRIGEERNKLNKRSRYGLFFLFLFLFVLFLFFVFFLVGTERVQVL